METMLIVALKLLSMAAASGLLTEIVKKVAELAISHTPPKIVPLIATAMGPIVAGVGQAIDPALDLTPELGLAAGAGATVLHQIMRQPMSAPPKTAGGQAPGATLMGWLPVLALAWTVAGCADGHAVGTMILDDVERTAAGFGAGSYEATLKKDGRVIWDRKLDCVQMPDGKLGGCHWLN